MRTLLQTLDMQGFETEVLLHVATAQDLSFAIFVDWLVVVGIPTRKQAVQKPMSQVIFQKHDKDGSGSIDASEFADMCYDMGHYLSPEQVEQALLAMDSNGNGEIEYEEFLQWWRKGEVRAGLGWAGLSWAGLG